jgi:hypothetical protein
MSDESHFIAEHIEQAAYLCARGRSWGIIANELKHYDADRLRRSMWKDAAFQAELDRARAELADECLAEGVMMLRARLREDDKARTLEAAQRLIDFAEREKARQHAMQIEQFKAAERARLQKERLDRLAELQKQRIDAAAALLDKRLAAQVKIETERAQTRTALGLGLPKTEKEKARRLQEQIANEERYHAANRRSTARMASEVARKEEVVWLPGGTHNVGYGETPGMEDKPFRLLSDGVDGRVIYWLVECPPTMMFPGDYQFVTNPDGSLIDAPEPAQRAVWNPQD